MRRTSARAGFSLVELVVVVTVLGVLARMLVSASESMSRLTTTGTIAGVLQGQGEEALKRIVADLRRSGYVDVAGKALPYVFDDGAPGDPDFAAHVHVPAVASAIEGDPDFGPLREIVFVLPSDLDSDGRPELDADLDGWPELDGNGDGVYSDDAADVDHLWDENANTIDPVRGLVWSRAEVSYVLVELADGSRVLQRRVNNDPNTARVVARHVERVQFDTAASSGFEIPLDSVRVRLFFRTTDEGGRLYRSRNEVVVRLRNG